MKLPAFFKCAPLARNEGMEEEGLFKGITAQIEAKFGKLGKRVVDDNMRVIRRGYDGRASRSRTYSNAVPAARRRWSFTRPMRLPLHR